MSLAAENRMDSSLKSSCDELFDLLSPDFPVRLDVRFASLKLAEQIFSSSDGSCLLLQNDCKFLSKLLQFISYCNTLKDEKERWQFKQEAYQVLLNPSADSALICKQLIGNKDFIMHLFNSDIFHNSSASKLSSNLTLAEENCSTICAYLDSNLRATLVSISNQFLRKTADAESGDYLGYLLRNLSQLSVVRQILLERNSESLDLRLVYEIAGILKLTGADADVSDLRKATAADIVRNCCLDTDLQEALLDSDDVLVALLCPLTGGEELSEEENDLLPLDLQYMEATKTREQNAAIRLKLLESLFQILSTTFGRSYLRDRGTYAVLRTYHLWETNEHAKKLCESVVGLLIQTETEIGCDNLKDAVL